MHEVGVAQSIMEIVLDTARKNNAAAVKKVGIKIGALSGVEQFSLKFALEAIKEGSLAHDAVFELEYIPARGICGECNKESEPDTFFSVCSHCNSPALEITSGEEFEIAYIDID